MDTPPENPPGNNSPDKLPVLLDDVIRLEHIATAARDIAILCAGADAASLDTDMKLRRALINAVQEIGEAASKVSDPTRLLMPSIPWGSIVQMRHIVVHVYWGVDLPRVWNVSVHHVPRLLSVIQDLLNRAEPFERP